MKITIVQTDIQWAAFDNNASAARNIIFSAGESDMYVLPEMWNTGFAVAKEEVSASSSDRALEWMQETARQTDAVVCGSMAVKNEDKANMAIHPYRNRLFFVKPDGSYTWYDKHHLFGPAGEDIMFAAGDKRVIAEWKGWRFLLTICYDLRFPLWLRYNNDYDAIINVANWPDMRHEAWDVLTKARAIENQCYFIACNRTGHDKTAYYSGHSRITDPEGRILTECEAGKQQFATTVIDKNKMTSYRRTFNVLDERDNK